MKKKGLDLSMKTYMEARSTSNMKKGWLYRNSYDEKNWEIARFDLDRGSSDDDDDDDDDPVMMIHLWSSDEDLCWWIVSKEYLRS